MKKITKKLIALLMALTMLLCTIPVHAETEINVNVAPEINTCLYRKAKENTQLFGNVRGTKKFTITTNAPSVIGLKKKENIYGGTDVFFIAKKPGTAIIYTKCGKNTYKTYITIKKYVNPVTSIKFGKTLVPGKKYNKNNVYTLPYKKFANKTFKIYAKAKKGWKVESVIYREKGKAYAFYTQNGKTITVEGGKGFQISVVYVNTKTNTSENIKFVFK